MSIMFGFTVSELCDWSHSICVCTFSQEVMFPHSDQGNKVYKVGVVA